MDNRTVLNKSDLIRIRYGNMRIFPDDFIHGGGFKNTISDGNFRIQLLIIDDGHKFYHPLKKTLITIMLMSQMKSCYVIILEKKNEDDDSNYNNSSVRNYTYSSFKPIEFCPDKKRTGVDLVPNPNPNNNKLHVYKTSNSGTNLDKCPSINLNHEELIVEPSSS